MAMCKEMQELLDTLVAFRDHQISNAPEAHAWAGEVYQLFGSFQRWLNPAVDQGLVTVTLSTTNIYESLYGTYAVPKLTVAPAWEPTKALIISPEGLNIYGVLLRDNIRVTSKQGRLKMSNGSPLERFPLYLLRNPDKTWCIGGELRGLEGFEHPLTEENFALALRTLFGFV